MGINFGRLVSKEREKTQNEHLKKKKQQQQQQKSTPKTRKNAAPREQEKEF